MENKVAKSKFKPHALQYFREVEQTGKALIITDRGKSVLKIVPYSEKPSETLSNMARECQVSRKIVENYLSVIEDLLLVYRLPVFTRRAKRALTAQPKFYLF